MKQTFVLDKICENCGRIILYPTQKKDYPKLHNKRRFCCRKCSDNFRFKNKITRKEIWTKYNQKLTTKENKRMWHEMKKFEHIGLLKNKQCKICGTDKNLLVHHLDGNNGYNNKLNNALNNLIVLCRKCHPSIHNKWWLKGVRV